MARTDTSTGGGPGGGITSINGDTTAAQILLAGTGINIAAGPAGTLTISSTAISISNTVAGVDPTVNDDDTMGYATTSRWFNRLTGISWVCNTAATGAADWRRELFDLAKSNLGAGVDPTGTDDDTLGYLVGSLWYNLVSSKLFICIDNTTTLAIWTQITNVVTGADPTVNDDLQAGNYVGQIWFNSTSQETFICTNSTNGAAVWLSLNGGTNVVNVSTAVYGSTTLMGAGLANLSLSGGSGLATVNLDTSNVPIGTVFTIMDTGLQAAIDNILIDAGVGNVIITNVSAQTATIVSNGTSLTLQKVDATSWKAI